MTRLLRGASSMRTPSPRGPATAHRRVHADAIVDPRGTASPTKAIGRQGFVRSPGSSPLRAPLLRGFDGAPSLAYVASAHRVFLGPCDARLRLHGVVNPGGSGPSGRTARAPPSALAADLGTGCIPIC